MQLVYSTARGEKEEIEKQLRNEEGKNWEIAEGKEEFEFCLTAYQPLWVI